MPSHTVTLEARVFLEEGQFVARCDALGISDHGDTERDAFENLGKTIALFFISGIRRGTLDSFLKKKGIVPTSVQTADGAPVYVPIVMGQHYAGASGR